MRSAERFRPPRLMKKFSIYMADWKGNALRRRLRSADRFSEAAICSAPYKRKARDSISSASLVRMTFADHLRVAFLRCAAPAPPACPHESQRRVAQWVPRVPIAGHRCVRGTVIVRYPFPVCGDRCEPVRGIRAPSRHDSPLNSPVPSFGQGWWARQDSNLRQHRYERRVLTN